MKERDPIYSKNRQWQLEDGKKDYPGVIPLTLQEEWK